MINEANAEETAEMLNIETDKSDSDLRTEQWLQVRKEEALKIDAETAEVFWMYRQVLDPYGVRQVSEEEYCVGREYFARSPGSDIWVWFGDLSDKTSGKLWEMHKHNLALNMSELSAMLLKANSSDSD